MPPARPRRSVLRSLAVGFAAALSACVAPRADSGDAPAGRPTTEPTAPTRTAAGPTSTEAPAAVEHVAVGERSGDINPYSIEIWNDVSTERTVTARVVDLTAGETPYEASLDLPPNGSLEVSLRAPHDYRIEISVPAADLHRTVQVTEREFDTCNEYRTQVALRADAVDVQTLRTELLCRTVTET